MHLLIVPVTDSCTRRSIELLIENYQEVIESITWFNVETKGRKYTINRPQIVGSLVSLLGYEEREEAHIFIKGRDNAKMLANTIKQLSTAQEQLVFGLPLAVF